MLGAIGGDMAGSKWEFPQLSGVRPVVVDGLWDDDSFYSDDTILTMAILEAILHSLPYEETLRKYGEEYRNYTPKFSPHFEKAFSPGFERWLDGKAEGTSAGNGAMMRISPVGYLFDNEEEVRYQARLATMPSHNSDEALRCAEMVALIILWARQGVAKEEIMERVNKAGFSFDYVPFAKFNTTCCETIGNCLSALFGSDDFEGSIKTILSYGGDTDTNACIVGSMAEALYGMPSEFKQEVMRRLPEGFQDLITRGYAQVKDIAPECGV